MGQMPAGIEAHAENRVPRLEQGEIDGAVGLGARMRLDIDEIRPEEGLCTRDRKTLGDIHMRAALIVAPARVALGILVGEHRAHGLEHRARDDVFGSDQLDLRLLTLQLGRNRIRDLRIHRPQPCGEKPFAQA